jgi:hypothetical protein
MHATPSNTESVWTYNPRPRYIPLGEDADGGIHVYRTVDETIFALDQSGRREYRFDTDDRPATVEDYVAHVAAQRGWYDRIYGRDAFTNRPAKTAASSGVTR